MYRIFCYVALSAILSTVLSFSVSAQVENFDSVTTPALPEEWSSGASGSGTPPQFRTADTFFDTAPNSLFCAGYGGVNRTMVHSPQFFMPRVPTQLSFMHKFSFEYGGASTNYDGGQLFFIPDSNGGYGAQYEWTAQFGSFSQNGYNGTISSGHSNQIEGQQAWVRIQPGFQTTTANLPQDSSIDTAQFAWALFSDSSVASSGWWIDSISVSPSVDLVVTQSASLNPGFLGRQLTFTTRVTNTSSSVIATNVKLHQTLPQDLSLAATAVSSGAAIPGSNVVDAVFSAILPNSSQSLSVTVNVPTQVSKAVYFETTGGPDLVRRAYPLRHLTFSPQPVEGVLATQAVTSFDFYPPSNDACEHQAFGNAGVGKIGITVRGGCALEDKIKNMQNASEIASIIVDDTDDPVPANGSSAGLSIPGFLAQSGDLRLLQQTAGSGLDVSLVALPSTLHFAARVRGDQFDPNALNNTASLLVPVGPDTRQAQFVASLNQAQKLLKGLKIVTSKSAKKKMALRVQALRALMASIAQDSGTIATLINGGSSLVKTVTSARKLVLKATRLKGGSFTSDKQKATAGLRKTLKLGRVGL